ncbi:ABC transporter ATP-binding protein [Candidatus Woesearchaeota archaeon]|nr:ABC transporter ATP-binding protein [Candidatus Woesearchaeota archaeon]
MNALHIENVSKIFPGAKKQTLNNVSFSIKEGEIYGLLGPNGAGKTTLISIIAGLLAKDTGAIAVFNYDIDKEPQEIKQILNVVPGFSHVNSSLSVDEFLAVYAHLYNVKDWQKERESVLKRVELKDKRSTQLNELSSGYKQRALLAKALLSKPKLLLMDEPTVGLDIEIAIKIRALMKELRAQGYTILLTTHNMMEVEELCDRIGLINNGKLVAEGTIKEIKKLVVERNGIEIECEDPKTIKSVFEKEPYTLEVKIMSTGCIIYVKEYKHIKEIMKKLAARKEKVYGISIMEPTLEETFIQLTGKKQRR